MQPNVENLKIDLKKKKIKGIALDIDETLAFTISFWVEELNLRFGNPEGLSASQIYEKYRLAQNVPFWQNKEAFEWMEWARKSNKVQEALPLIENSNKIVQKIEMVIPVVAYLTVRSESVLPGTEKWLHKHGFPKAEIIAKPNDLPYEKGSEWKAGVLSYLYPQVAGIIDDTPVIIEHLPKNYKGYVFLYNNSDESLNRKNIIPCKNWDLVLNEVIKKFSIKNSL